MVSVLERLVDFEVLLKKNH